MHADQRGLAPERDRDAAELAALRVTCQRQATVIKTMTHVIATLRQGTHALKAENTQLRAIDADAGRGVASMSRQSIETRVPLDVRAPGAARIVVAQVLGERAAALVLDRAKLVMSELVSNSVRHSGAPAGAGVVLRVRAGHGGFWLEVEDPGRDGVVAQHAANEQSGGGFGLHIVQALSERWGIERAAEGGTRVWAQLSDTAPSTGEDYGERGEATLPSALGAAGAALNNTSQGRPIDEERHHVR
jgi:anti-sigma regulatory factor (Ser/Thr protein kinase)